MASRADVEAGKAYVKLYVRDNDLAAGLRKAGQRLQAFGASTIAAGGAVAGVGAAILAPIIGAVTNFAAVGDTLDKMSQRTGIAGSALAELGFAAEQSGGSLADVEQNIKVMQRTLDDANDGMATATLTLDKLGVSLDDLRGKSPDQQFETIADGLARINDPGQRAAAAMEIFGRSGAKLLPLLNGGAEGIRKLREEARDLGLAPSEEDIANAAKLTDAMNRVRRSIGAIVFQIGAAVAPVVENAIAQVMPLVKSTTAWITENRSLVVAIAGVGAALVAVGGVVVGFGVALSAAGIALSAIGSLLTVVLSPVGLVTTALVAGAVAWTRYTESGWAFVSTVGTAFAPMLQTVRDTLGGIFDALAGGDLQLAGEIAFAGLKLAAMEGLNGLSQLVGGEMGKLIQGIGGLLIEGKFQEAWQAGIQAITVGLKQFASWAIGLFAGLGNQIIGLWAKTTSALSGSILELAAKDNIFGSLISTILGVDVKAEIAKSTELNRKLGLEQGDPLSEMKAAAASQIDGQAKAATDAINAFDLTFKTDLDAARQKLKAMTDSGAAGLDVDAARADLQALLERAKSQRDQQAAAAAAAGGGAGGLAAAIGATTGVAGSFSAAALGLLGQSGGPQERAAKAAEKAVVQNDELIQLDEMMLAELKKTGMVAFQ